MTLGSILRRIQSASTGVWLVRGKSKRLSLIVSRTNAVRFASEYHLQDLHIHMVVQECIFQRGDQSFEHQKKGRATRSAPYPRYHIVYITAENMISLAIISLSLSQNDHLLYSSCLYPFHPREGHMAQQYSLRTANFQGVKHL